VEVAKAKGRPPTLSEMRKAIYKTPKTIELLSDVAVACYRETLAIARSYMASGAKGRTPVVNTLHMWLHKRTKLKTAISTSRVGTGRDP